MSPEAGPGDRGLESEEHALLGALVVVGLLAGAVLLAGHLSAFLFEGGWPRYPLEDVPRVLGRAVTHPLDPGEGWDRVNQGTPTPGPVAWWLTFLLIVAAVVVPVVLLVRAGDRAQPVLGRAAGGRAAARDVRRHGLAREHPNQVVVGTMGGQEVALPTGDSLLVLGPVRSGKTTAISIPAVLEWQGPVVATSTAGELIERTIGTRSRLGDVHVYDPMAITSYRRSGWSPLATCTTWQGATRTAWDLAMAGKASIGTTTGVGELWYSSAARSLAPYLFAAAESSRTMADVARWIDTEECDEVLAELRTVEPDAAVAHTATFRRDDTSRASLFHVMRLLVGAYLDPMVAASALRHEIEPDELLDGDPHTLYIAAPHHDRARVRPLFAALVRRTLNTVHQRVERTRKPLDSPLLLVLDDAVDVAPVEDLATQAATGGAAGVQIVTLCEDVTQIGVRYGDDAAGVIKNHRAKLVIAGAGGADAAELAASVAGGAEGGGGDGNDGGTATGGAASRLGSELTRRVPSSEALLLHEDRDLLRVQLRPWYRDRELRRRAGVEQDALAPAAGEAAAPAAPGLPFEPLPSNPRGPVSNPVPSPDPEDMDPHLVSNVSPLDAARARLRRRRSEGDEDG